MRPAAASPDNGDLQARFDFNFAVKSLALTLRPDGHLVVTTATRYTDKSERKPRTSSDMLVRTTG